MTRTHKPPHSGETLREDVLPALDLTCAALSRVLNGSAAISPVMALRVEG